MGSHSVGHDCNDLAAAVAAACFHLGSDSAYLNSLGCISSVVPIEVFVFLAHISLLVLERNLIAQLVKNLPTIRETWCLIPGLGRSQIPLEQGKATHSSILAWRIP